MTKEELMERAKKASENAYAIYSNFRVGAALLTKEGQCVVGCNIENASYGLCNCAERTCLFSAYSMGIKKEDIVAFAVYSPLEHLVTPCGACRQVMHELLLPTTPVYMAYGKEIKYQESSVEQLLPYSFTGDDLHV